MNWRLRISLLGLGALLVVAVFTFPLWQPLLTNVTVNEAFPGLPADLQDDFLALPADQRTMLLEMQDLNKNDPELANEALETTRSMLGGDTEVAEDMTPDMTEPMQVVSGEFIEMDVLHKGAGTATIYRLPDDTLALRLEDFRVTNGPDLRVILSRHPAPLTRSEVGSDYRDLGVLKGNIGSQNYSIPADVKIDEYHSVVIYCLSFHVVFSTATLE